MQPHPHPHPHPHPTLLYLARQKWKDDSNAFREAMRSARQVTTALATGAPMPAPLAASGPDPSLTPCPHWCVLAIVDVDVGAADDNGGEVDKCIFLFEPRA